MTDNPLEDDAGRDQRIRERAYHLWQADGEPYGQHEEYWERASALVAMEESRNTGQIDPVADEKRRINGQVVEEATLQDNLGEFPDRLSDQGEHPQVPSRANLVS